MDYDTLHRAILQAQSRAAGNVCGMRAISGRKAADKKPFCMKRKGFYVFVGKSAYGIWADDAFLNTRIGGDFACCRADFFAHAHNGFDVFCGIF